VDVIAVTSSDNAPPILIGFDIPCIVIVFPEGAKFTFADAVRFPVTVVFPVMFPMRLEVTENAVRFPVTVVFPVMFPVRFEVTENAVRFPVTVVFPVMFPMRFEVTENAVRFPVTVVFPVMFPMRFEVTENAVRFPVTVVFPVMFPMRFEVTENPVRFPVTFPVRFENVLGAYNEPYVYKLEPEIDPITVKLPIKVLDVNKPC